ncbi:enoyl-CoA hydratase/isomerase family protein [Gammaproteobacteria bacterium LSUCC0057]|uniref:Enoyl-CoA hydratase/isomerase family protein n=1 Tax=Gammaproteobacteria bacterium LSUCC0057 TaxID=2559237 RepID=A0A4Y8UPK0_9GAMM|nr:enoyl-CoA hydratase/isomerase family protein [Gammaproteobacteria bacterium LSUCC0057]
MSDKLQLQVDARGVATVTLDNPEQHNAFDDQLIAALKECFDRLAADSAVRVVVLAATGKSFSAGADLGYMQKMAGYSHADNQRDAEQLAAMLAALNNLPMPTIAAVQGAAFGGAVGLVSCCDMAVASERASFCLSEVKLGLIPATISPYVLRAIGERAARRYFTTAERFSAATAAQLGLVSHVVADHELAASCAQLVETLLGNGPQALRAAKALVLDYAGQPIDAALIRDSSERIARLRVSAEGQEGLAAFFAKRPPRWQQ